MILSPPKVNRVFEDVKCVASRLHEKCHGFARNRNDIRESMPVFTKCVTKIAKNVTVFVNTPAGSPRYTKNTRNQGPGARGIDQTNQLLVIQLLRRVNGLAGNFDAELAEHVKVD